MPWKTEIDRLVHHLVMEAGQSGSNSDVRRAVRTIADLNALAPEREANSFHAGALEELLDGRDIEDLDAILEDLPDDDADVGSRWHHLGRLDAASRSGARERVRSLMDDDRFEASLDHPEGRVALRAVGRMLLREGSVDRAFELYRKHLEAVDEDGSRRDAEFLLEESLRRADRGDVTIEDSIARLERASEFAEACELDARARSKVDRKAGRIHQLEGNWDDATSYYQRALDRLPDEDPYRSVLVGDLALAMLGVRGTLDLVPTTDREGSAEARTLLESGQKGDGRSYNAIYTLGMLAYEAADWENAAQHFREADELMRENRAKARIVHARSRFFLGHCLLKQGVEGEELEKTERLVLRNAGAISLDAELKGPVFDTLVEFVPGARIPGRPTQRQQQAAKPLAPQHLETARKKLEEGDLHAALGMVDKAFKSRPDFETWFGAYRMRLEALVGLEERDEALRTYERFRAKLYQREALGQLETFLQDREGPIARLLDDEQRDAELVGLFEMMPERDEALLEVGQRVADNLLKAEDAEHVRRGLALLQELSARSPDAVAEALEAASEKAKSAGALEEAVDKDETRALLKEEEEPVRILVVGGDVERPATMEQFKALAGDYGFEGSWVVTGARPPYKTLREIAGQAQDSDVVLLHHALGADMRGEVQRLGEKYDVPVREAAWIGPATLESELLQTLNYAFVD